MGYSTLIPGALEDVGAALALYVPVCLVQMVSKSLVLEMDEGQLHTYFKSRNSENPGPWQVLYASFPQPYLIGLRLWK